MGVFGALRDGIATPLFSGSVHANAGLRYRGKGGVKLLGRGNEECRSNYGERV
jgi:hypothetical protein